MIQSSLYLAPDFLYSVLGFGVDDGSESASHRSDDCASFGSSLGTCCSSGSSANNRASNRSDSGCNESSRYTAFGCSPDSANDCSSDATENGPSRGTDRDGACFFFLFFLFLYRIAAIHHALFRRRWWLQSVQRGARGP